MGLSRQEYWGGLSCPPPGDLPDPGIKTASSATPTLQADSTLLSHRGSPIRITTLPQNISSLGHSPKYIHTYIHTYIYVYVWYFCYCLATKLCLTLRNPMDCSLPGSFVFGISQARILEGAASSFSSKSSWLWFEPESPSLAGRFFITEPPGKLTHRYGFCFWSIVDLSSISWLGCWL